MDATQAKIIDLLREVHLIALKELERLNLRILELESQSVESPPKESAAGPTPPSPPQYPGIMTEDQVADYLGITRSGARRWRMLRTGPKFLKLGSRVRYRREDVDAWLESSVVDVNRSRDRRNRRS